jgi:hypothetical protein
MFTEIKAWFASAEAVLWAVGAVALLGWGLWAVHHERDIGRQQVIAADAAARADEDKKIAAQEAAMKAQADQAEKNREATQQTFDAYVAAHPTGPVWVCHGASNNGKLPGGSAPAGGAAGAGTGSAAVPQVPDGSAGASTDISPELDTIVQSAGRLAILYKDAQSQPTVSSAPK